MTTVPPQSTTAPAVSAPKKVSSAGYWIALAIFLVGSGAAVAWFTVTILGVANAPSDFVRTTGIPAEMRVEIGTGEWVLYHEYPGANSLGFAVTPDVEVTDPSGNPVTVRSEGFGSIENYDVSGHEGESMARFDADTAGIYTITVSGEREPDQSVAIGRPLFDGAILGIAGSIVLGGVCFLIALVLFIMTLVRRGRAKKAAAAAPYQPAPAAPGAPGSFAAPIPTAPTVPAAPPAPGQAGAPVPPPPGAVPVSNEAYTPGWAAPADEPVPPPAPSGFTSPGAPAAPVPPPPAAPVPPPPAAPVPPPPAPAGAPVPPPPAPDQAPGPGGEAPPASDETKVDESWDKPGEF